MKVSKSSNENKKGFTLAEVLITLGIIGVVAAITIPTLTKSYNEKRVVTQVTHAFSIISQVMERAVYENGPLEYWSLSKNSSANETNAKTIASMLRPYLQIAVDCGVSDLKHVCLPSGYKYLKGTGTYGANSWEQMDKNSAYYKLIMTSGTTLVFNYDTGGGWITFRIDINGPEKPNIIGKDLFQFLYKDGLLTPDGALKLNTTSPYNGDGCLGANARGWGCAYIIIKDKKMNY